MPVTVDNKSNLEKIDEIKKILRSLLISRGSSSVTVRQLNAMFKEMEGRYIPFKDFNYSNLNEFLRDMPDTLNLHYNNNELCVYYVKNEKSAHVSSLVARQKKSTRRSKSNVRYTPRNHSFQQSTKPKQQIFSDPTNVLNQILQELKNSCTHSKVNSGINKIDILLKMSEKINNPVYTIHDLNVQLQNFLHILVIEDDCIYFKDLIPFKRENLKTNKEVGNSVNFNKSTTYSSETIKTNKSVNNQMPHIEQIHLDNDSIKEKASISNENSNDNINDQMYKKIQTQSDSVIKERTKIRLQKLIEKHPEGIWCLELPSLYKNEYSIDLEYNDLGFSSIIEFVAAIPDIFVIVEPLNTNKQMVLNAKDSVNIENQQKKTLASYYNFNDYIKTESEPIPVKLSLEVSQALIPEGVMRLNETVDCISVNSFISEDYIEVIISEVFTPSFFWITLRKNKKKIKLLMNELDEFYSSQDLDEYRIPQVILEPGLNIACTYDKMWHRGIVKKIKPDGFIVILFYDYGTIRTYNPNDLYFLHKRFSALPAQAIACGLHNIKPIESKTWPKMSTIKFINKVWNVPLVAIISNISDENNSMMISLTDTSDDTTDLHLNDWMVENQLAEWGKMINSVPMQDIYMYDEIEQQNIQEQDHNKCITTNKTNINNIEGENKNGEVSGSQKIHVISPNPSFNCPINYSNDASNVKCEKNGDLTKHTNNLEESTLLSIPNNHNELSNNTVDCTNLKMENGISEKKLDSRLSISEDFEKQFGSGVSNNLRTSKINTCEMDNYSETELKQNCDSSIHSLESNSFDFVSKSVHYDNNNVEKLQQQNEFDNNSLEFDHLSFYDGTPFYEIISSTENLNINIHENISEKTIDSEHKNSNESEGVNEDSYTAKFSSQTNNNNNNLFSMSNDYSSTSMYFTTSLSEKCDNKTMHIFHLNNEGWVCTSELVDAFTNLKDQRILYKFLEILDYNVNFKYLTRDIEPQLFAQLDKSTLKTPRESTENKITANYILTLLSLKDMLQVLVNLDFLNSKMLKEALPLMKQCKGDVENVLYERYKNKILYDALNLLVQYKKFKRMLKTTL